MRQQASAVALALILSSLVQPCLCFHWPLRKPLPDITTRAKCDEASHGHVWPGNTVYAPLQDWLGLGGPIVNVPQQAVDITTVNTLVQLATPHLKLVLDPLLYLQLLPTVSGIPKVIHMTMRSKLSIAPHQVISIISWGKFNQGYALLLYDDKDMELYISRYYPNFLPTYKRLQTPVEKSDAWRYHVLCGHGGIYTDTDTVCAVPFDKWFQSNGTAEPGLVVGIENVFRSQEDAEEATYVKKIQMIQWTMAAKQAHPVLCRMGGYIKAFMDNETATPADSSGVSDIKGHDASILLRTGPGIWSDAVHTYLRQIGLQPEQFVAGGQATDVVILPQVALGCNFR